MKKIILIITLVTLPLLLHNVYSLSGNAVLRKTDKAMRSKSSRSFVIMKVYSGYDSYRTVKMKSYTLGTNMSYSHYVYPKNISGMKYLSRGDNIWMYYPKTNRVRKLAAHMEKRPISGVGGDFAAQDMKNVKYSKKYRATDKKVKNDKYVITAKGIKKKTYKKLVLHIKKSNFVPVQIDYYNEYGRKFKTLFMENIVKINGVWVAKKLVMKSYERGAKTVVEMKALKVNIPVSRRYFSISNLRS